MESLKKKSRLINNSRKGIQSFIAPYYTFSGGKWIKTESDNGKINLLPLHEIKTNKTNTYSNYINKVINSVYVNPNKPNASHTTYIRLEKPTGCELIIGMLNIKFFNKRKWKS